MTFKQPYFWTAFFVLVASGIYRATITTALSGDVAMYLQCGQLILQGQTIYVDFIDLNPPLINFLSVIPAALAAVTHLPLLLVGSITCSVTALFSLVVTALILEKARAADLIAPQISGSMLLALSTVSAFTTYDFGQREHLLVLALVPYICLRWARLNGLTFNRLLTFGLAFATGLLSCFKPHFLLCPIVIELSLMLPLVWRKQKKVFGGEYLGLVAGGLSYAIGLVSLPAPARDYLFGYLTPLVLNGYSAFDSDKLLVMFTELWVPTLLVVAIASALWGCTYLPFFRQSSSPDPSATVSESWRQLALAVFIQVLCGLLLIQIQHKGWCYHGILMMVFALQLGGMAYGYLALRLKPMVSYATLSALVTIAVVASSFWTAGVHRVLHVEWEPVLPQYIKPGDRVAYLDTSDAPWFVRAVEHDYRPGSRILWMFPVPIYESLLKRGKIDKEGADRAFAHLTAMLGEDLDRYKAPLVVIPTTGCYALPKHFDMHEHLLAHGLGAALKDYDLVQKTPRYRYYYRKH